MTDITADVLHAVSQALQIPVIVLLLLLMAYSIFCVGTLIAEVFSERKNYRVVMPELMKELEAADAARVPKILQESGLLKRQKKALDELWQAAELSEETRYALAKRLVAGELDHYGAITGRTDLVAKIGPMLGLMGTLIPLGPGIVALGTGDVATLSGALLIAFDTTVAGLGAAGVSLCVSKVRKRWYRQYMETFEAVTTTLLEKLDALEAEGVQLGAKGASHHA